MQEFSSLPPLRVSRGKDGVGRGQREGKEPQKKSPPRSLGSLRERETNNPFLGWICWARSLQTNPAPQAALPGLANKNIIFGPYLY